MDIRIITPDQKLDTEALLTIQSLCTQLDQWDYQCNKAAFSGYPELEAIRDDIRHPQSLERIDKVRVEHKSTYLLAYDEDKVVGFVDVSTYYSQPITYWRFMKRTLPDVMTLDQICVSETVRSGGIGSALMDAAKKYSKSQGCRDMILGYLSGNQKADMFYRKHRFRNIERFYVLRKPTGRQPHTPWIWSEVDGSSKVHLARLTPLIKKCVDTDCLTIPSMRFVESEITNGIIYEVKNKKLRLFGCNGGKDGYLICSTVDDMFDISFIFFPDAMWKHPKDAIEAVRAIPSCCNHERWLTIPVVQDKLDRALNPVGFRLYSVTASCKL